ncbi:thiamine pyrophosphate-binding protein [Blastococcus brunescens]
MPLDFQRAEVGARQLAELERLEPPSVPALPAAAPSAVAQLADLLERAERPVIVGGRGAAGAVPEIRRLAELTGALLTTSAVGRGLFHDDPWHLDVMGGFSTDGAAELISGADVLVAFGAALNRWTTRDGTFLRNPTVAQVDDTPAAFGFHYPVDLEVLGDSALTAKAVADLLEERGTARRVGYRTDDVAEKVAASLNWSDQEFDDRSEPVDPAQPGSGRIDPRALTNAIDALVPMDRVVVPDGGNFNAYPAMHLRVPDNRGYCLPLAFQSIGLALASAVGSAVATPGRVVVAGIGDGGFMMSLVELDTAVRLSLPLVVVVYDDNAYSAEVHHFVHETDRLETVVFPDTDLAAIARGFGCEGIVVRSVEDLEPLRDWLEGRRPAPSSSTPRSRSSRPGCSRTASPSTSESSADRPPGDGDLAAPALPRTAGGYTASEPEGDVVGLTVRATSSPRAGSSSTEIRWVGRATLMAAMGCGPVTKKGAAAARISGLRSPRFRA